MTHSSEAVKPISLICEFNRRIIAKFGLRPITTRQGNHPSSLGTDSPLYRRSLAPTTLVPTFLFRILGPVHFPLILSYEMARKLTYWLCFQVECGVCALPQAQTVGPLRGKRDAYALVFSILRFR